MDSGGSGYVSAGGYHWVRVLHLGPEKADRTWMGKRWPGIDVIVM